MNLEPLFMAPHFTRQPWGGDALARLYGKNIPGVPTGESWEASAYPDAPSRVARGTNAGRTLARVVEAWGRDLLGGQEGFGLLVKLIDARERLSVQVHPDDAFAAAHGLPRGKTEAWVVLNADVDARIALGVDAERETFERMAREGAVEEILHWIPVEPGDAFALPAGIVHALGSSALIYEVQQASDATYRLHDWGRGRELHLDLACAAANPELCGERAIPEVVEEENLVLEKLIANPYFSLDRLNLTGRIALETDGARYAVVTALDPVSVCWGEQKAVARGGETFIVPAALGAWSIEPAAAGEGAILLCAYPA